MKKIKKLQDVDINSVMNAIDYAWLEEEWATGEAGDKIYIRPDGRLTIIGSGSSLNPNDPEPVVAMILVEGIGNIDIYPYAEEFAEYDSDKDLWIINETGELVDDREMVRKSIRSGEIYPTDWMDDIQMSYFQLLRDELDAEGKDTKEIDELLGI